MKFGLTPPFGCSYLPEKDEQLLVYADDSGELATKYGKLIQYGFRRSGNDIYRPHCPSCNACESIRVPVAAFSASRSQKRLLKKNANFHTRISEEINAQYYPLYERYICERHSDGAMYPPQHSHFFSFITCDWNPPVYIEAYDGDDLIAVAVTDVVRPDTQPESFSALYTFFDPLREDHSLGTWMVLQQIRYAQATGKEYLYLGYQIDDCEKMNYKVRYRPNERFFDTKWQKNRTNSP